MRQVATRWRVDIGEQQQVAAVFEPAEFAGSDRLFICAHGAGGHMEDRAVQAASRELRRRGLHIVRFNFAYREKQSRVPDPMPRLQRCYEAVAQDARMRLEPKRLILGGRSLGGRVATMLAANGFACDGLLLLAYPLHPPGRPDKLRDEHLARIGVPVLCCNGTRDTFCQRELMERAVGGLTHWSMHWLEGADHSFHGLKSMGRDEAAVLAEVGAACATWLEQTGL